MSIHKGSFRLGQLSDQCVDSLLIVIGADDFTDFRFCVQFSGGGATLSAYA